MTGNLISWFNDTITHFEELEKFTYNFEKYYGKPPEYISIPIEDYFELVRDINNNYVGLFQQLGTRLHREFEYQGVPVKASNIIRHGVMTDMYHKPAYKREWT